MSVYAEHGSIINPVHVEDNFFISYLILSAENHEMTWFSHVLKHLT